MTKEDYKLLPLAAAGFGAGLFKYYVKPELTAKRGWAAIGLGVLAYELACAEGQLLSEGADRAIEKHPVLTRAAIGITALHLSNAIPDYLDPIHMSVKAAKNILNVS